MAVKSMPSHLETPIYNGVFPNPTRHFPALNHWYKTNSCISALVVNRAPVKSDIGAAVGAEVLLAENKRAQRRITAV